MLLSRAVFGIRAASAFLSLILALMSPMTSSGRFSPSSDVCLTMPLTNTGITCCASTICMSLRHLKGDIGSMLDCVPNAPEQRMRKKLRCMMSIEEESIVCMMISDGKRGEAMRGGDREDEREGMRGML